MYSASMPERRAIRRAMKARRLALPPRIRREAGRLLALHFAKTPLFRRSRRIAFYLPHRGEIDPTPLMEKARRMGKEVYLPVLHPMRGRPMAFAPHGGRMVKNRFGIPEPDVPPRLWLSARHLDLILLPLVAFDAQGHRLGMGGGFYDRTLAFLHRRTRWHRPRLVGLAYSFQEVEALPAHPWDVPLDGVATERGIMWFQPAAGK